MYVSIAKDVDTLQRITMDKNGRADCSTTVTIGHWNESAEWATDNARPDGLTENHGHEIGGQDIYIV